MNNSSAQDSYLITSLNSSDTITLPSGSYTDCHTITLNTSCIPSSSTITFTGGTAGSQYAYGAGSTVGGIGSINWGITQEEFVNCFPDFNRIEKMCEEYPGLKIAYEKFVTTYRLIKDDYDTPKDKRPKP
jgi:hypothetical protein